MDATFFEDLADIVLIQDDATVSKVIHSDDRIRVVAFAFDSGQELTEHTAAVPAIVQVVRGEVAFTTEGTTLVMTPGSWIHLPANAAHSVVARIPSVLLLTLLRG